MQVVGIRVIDIVTDQNQPLGFHIGAVIAGHFPGSVILNGHWVMRRTTQAFQSSGAFADLLQIGAQHLRQAQQEIGKRGWLRVANVSAGLKSTSALTGEDHRDVRERMIIAMFDS